jgi:hypothetical protein
MESAEPTAKPARAWRRGLVFAGIALLVALFLRDRDRSAPGRAPAGVAPLPAPRPLPGNTDLGAPSQARPRLLVLLPETVAPPFVGLPARLRQAAGDRLAVVEADRRVAQALGVEALPAFILYSASGREEKRLSGPDAVERLAAELQARGLPAAGLAGGEAP